LIVDLAGGERIELSIVPLDDILPHEKTISSLLKTIRYDMRRTGCQRDPILVDRRTHLALDGMHRIEALRSLGAKYAVCAEYDFNERSVRLERWLRTLVAPSRKILSTIVSKFEMIPCTSFRTAIHDVETGRATVALLSHGESFVSTKRWGIRDLYLKIGETDELCKRAKVELQFFPDTEKYDLFSSESVVTLFPAKLSKKDVLRMAENNELLPFKTTRYTVTIRPMGISYPISYLRNCTLPKCLEKLDQIVNFSKVILERRNVPYEGRRYSDRIAVFRRISR
jgi:hypothetical protein